MRRIVFAVLAVTVFGACQPAPSNEESSQVPLSPQTAVAEVRQVFQQYVDDWNAPNIDAVLAVLADDVVQMPPDTVIVGKEALSANWRSFFAENTIVWEPTIDEIQAADNLVFIITGGTETTTPRAPTNSPIFPTASSVISPPFAGCYRVVGALVHESEPSG